VTSSGDGIDEAAMSGNAARTGKLINLYTI
jgi:hypothetical protein